MIRSYLHCGDFLYDQSYNDSFKQKKESIQYNAALAITGATGDISRKNFYQEIG